MAKLNYHNLLGHLLNLFAFVLILICLYIYNVNNVYNKHSITTQHAVYVNPTVLKVDNAEGIQQKPIQIGDTHVGTD